VVGSFGQADRYQLGQFYFVLVRLYCPSMMSELSRRTTGISDVGLGTSWAPEECIVLTEDQVLELMISHKAVCTICTRQATQGRLHT